MGPADPWTFTRRVVFVRSGLSGKFDQALDNPDVNDAREVKTEGRTPGRKVDGIIRLIIISSLNESVNGANVGPNPV